MQLCTKVQSRRSSQSSFTSSYQRKLSDSSSDDTDAGCVSTILPVNQRDEAYSVFHKRRKEHYHDNVDLSALPDRESTSPTSWKWASPRPQRKYALPPNLNLNQRSVTLESFPVGTVNNVDTTEIRYIDESPPPSARQATTAQSNRQSLEVPSSESAAPLSPRWRYLHPDFKYSFLGNGSPRTSPYARKPSISPNPANRLSNPLPMAQKCPNGCDRFTSNTLPCLRSNRHRIQRDRERWARLSKRRSSKVGKEFVDVFVPFFSYRASSLSLMFSLKKTSNFYFRLWCNLRPTAVEGL